LIHIVTQKLATGFVGILIFAAGGIEHVPAQPLLLLQKSDSTLFCKCPQRQRLRLLQI
jgi:hypothetical protein